MRHQIMSADQEEPLFEIDEPDYVSPVYEAFLYTWDEGNMITLGCTDLHCTWEASFSVQQSYLTQMQEVFSEHVNGVHLNQAEEATRADLPVTDDDLALDDPDMMQTLQDAVQGSRESTADSSMVQQAAKSTGITNKSSTNEHMEF